MTEPIKGLTLHQPWAELVAVGAKEYETRSWEPSYRGLLAIHARKRQTREQRILCSREPFSEYFEDFDALPFGAIVAVARLEACVVTEVIDDIGLGYLELGFGDFSFGRYAWHLTDVVRLDEPIPCRGYQQLWRLPEDVEATLRAAIREGGPQPRSSESEVLDLTRPEPTA